MSKPHQDSGSDTGLSPCPFCGGKAVLRTTEGWSGIGCETDKCPAYLHALMFRTPFDARARWNRRWVDISIAPCERKHLSGEAEYTSWFPIIPRDATACPHGTPHRWPCEQCDGTAGVIAARASLALPAEGAEPVGWLDDKGEFHRSPRHHFLGLVDESCGSADHIWSGTSLDEACEAWKRFVAQGSKDVNLTGWGCGTIASHREMEERLGAPKGTFSCPICGLDTPHQHSAEAVARSRENDAWYAEQRDKQWAGIVARVAALESRYPTRTPLYAYPLAAAPHPPQGRGAAGEGPSHMHAEYADGFDDGKAQERERCARIADDEARIREEAGSKHVEGSQARSNCFAGARAAANVAKGIRNGEEVSGVALSTLPHPIGTIFSDGYWNLNVMLREPAEVEPRWRQRGQADVYTADQVRELLCASAPRGAAGEGGEQTVPDDGEVWEQVARDIAANPRPIEEIKRDVAKVRERIDRAAGLHGDAAQEGGK